MDQPDLSMMLMMAVVLFTGSMLQTAAGFGFALFTVPLLVLLGCRPYEAIVLVAIGAAVQALVGICVLRRHVRWRRVLAMIALASVAMPFGVAMLGALDQHDGDLVRRVFGAIVLLALIMLLALRVRPRERLPRGAMVGAMLASGFMGGLSGMSGPPAVLWVMAHRWSNPESRATLWALFGGTMPVQLLLLRREFGPPVTDAAGLALALTPAALLGLLPGLWIGHRISKERLRTVGTLLIAALGLYAMLS